MRVNLKWVGILLGVGMATLGIAAYVILVVSKGELGEARGWAVLQSVEVKHRSDAETETPILLSGPIGSSFVVLGLPTEGAKLTRVWIILNETTPNSSVYILPQNQRFHVSCPYVEGLSATVKIEPFVLSLLRGQCVTEPR